MSEKNTNSLKRNKSKVFISSNNLKKVLQEILSNETGEHNTGLCLNSIDKNKKLWYEFVLTQDHSFINNHRISNSVIKKYLKNEELYINSLDLGELKNESFLISKEKAINFITTLYLEDLVKNSRIKEVLKTIKESNTNQELLLFNNRLFIIENQPDNKQFTIEKEIFDSEFIFLDEVILESFLTTCATKIYEKNEESVSKRDLKHYKNFIPDSDFKQNMLNILPMFKDVTSIGFLNNFKLKFKNYVGWLTAIEKLLEKTNSDKKYRMYSNGRQDEFIKFISKQAVLPYEDVYVSYQKNRGFNATKIEFNNETLSYNLNFVVLNKKFSVELNDSNIKLLFERTNSVERMTEIAYNNDNVFENSFNTKEELKDVLFCNVKYLIPNFDIKSEELSSQLKNIFNKKERISYLIDSVCWNSAKELFVIKLVDEETKTEIVVEQTKDFKKLYESEAIIKKQNREKTLKYLLLKNLGSDFSEFWLKNVKHNITSKELKFDDPIRITLKNDTRKELQNFYNNYINISEDVEAPVDIDTFYASYIEQQGIVVNKIVLKDPSSFPIMYLEIQDSIFEIELDEKTSKLFFGDEKRMFESCLCKKIKKIDPSVNIFGLFQDKYIMNMNKVPFHKNGIYFKVKDSSSKGIQELLKNKTITKEEFLSSTIQSISTVDGDKLIDANFDIVMQIPGGKTYIISTVDNLSFAEELSKNISLSQHKQNLDQSGASETTKVDKKQSVPEVKTTENKSESSSNVLIPELVSYEKEIKSAAIRAGTSEFVCSVKEELIPTLTQQIKNPVTKKVFSSIMNTAQAEAVLSLLIAISLPMLKKGIKNETAGVVIDTLSKELRVRGLERLITPLLKELRQPLIDFITTRMVNEKGFEDLRIRVDQNIINSNNEESQFSVVDHNSQSNQKATTA